MKNLLVLFSIMMILLGIHNFKKAISQFSLLRFKSIMILAFMFLFVNGIMAQSEVKGVKRLKKKCLKGDTESCEKLADIFLQQKDYKNAAYFYMESNNNEGLRRVGDLYLSLDSLGKSLQCYENAFDIKDVRKVADSYLAKDNYIDALLGYEFLNADSLIARCNNSIHSKIITGYWQGFRVDALKINPNTFKQIYRIGDDAYGYLSSDNKRARVIPPKSYINVITFHALSDSTISLSIKYKLIFSNMISTCSIFANGTTPIKNNEFTIKLGNISESGGLVLIHGTFLTNTTCSGYTSYEENSFHAKGKGRFDWIAKVRLK